MRTLAVLVCLSACAADPAPVAVSVALAEPPPALTTCPPPVAVPPAPPLVVTPQRLKEAFDVEAAARLAERRRGTECAAKLDALTIWIKAHH
jgi:hypothetical protein